MDKEQVLKHTLELLDYIEKENYLGYDPYDFYLSSYKFPSSYRYSYRYGHKGIWPHD